MGDKKCSCDMVEITTKEGVTVDFCPETGGILFDPGEAALFFELAEDIPALVKENAVATGRSWENPKTPGGKLVEYRFPDLDDLMLDICDKTGAIWFDKGEVPRFEKLTAALESPRSRLVRVFGQLRSEGYEVLGIK